MSQIYAIGIDIGGTNIKAGIVDGNGIIIREDTIPTEAVSGKKALLSKIAATIEMYQKYALKQGIDLVGAGIGTAGYVNRRGVIGGATENLPGWSGTRLKEELELRAALPVWVDNDVNAMASGEVWLGAGRPYDQFLCVALGTGVGGCLIVNKQPYRGRSGYAGGYGHQVIVFEGEPCTCGLRGCWEQYASVTGLKRMIRERMADVEGASLSPIDLFDRARSGDEIALQIVDKYAQYIAVGLANLIHVFNPTAIIVGGAVTLQGDFLFDRIRKYVSLHTLKVYIEEDIPIVPATLGEMAGMIGAAKLVFDSNTEAMNQEEISI
ncbi:ROK family protein [Paenibacillus psychroresistens]|uniref:ROK family protein n=1 Tax=Paenibacillus psychroresistens TaxID=1778678 RepID=A0A6B8REY1_9BACL|nr:ROK family protein [Paenibacillus psychroresistens]QGQ93916.1 ROK family protein [Paenibacillus psychroresistens]